MRAGACSSIASQLFPVRVVTSLPTSLALLFFITITNNNNSFVVLLTFSCGLLLPQRRRTRAFRQTTLRGALPSSTARAPLLPLPQPCGSAARGSASWTKSSWAGLERAAQQQEQQVWQVGPALCRQRAHSTLRRQALNQPRLSTTRRAATAAGHRRLHLAVQKRKRQWTPLS